MRRRGVYVPLGGKRLVVLIDDLNLNLNLNLNLKVGEFGPDSAVEWLRQLQDQSGWYGVDYGGVGPSPLSSFKAQP